jgi:hypothetical protein
VLMDWMLDAFWRTWPWSLMVLMMLLLSGGAAYIGWLSMRNWSKNQADDNSQPVDVCQKELARQPTPGLSGGQNRWTQHSARTQLTVKAKAKTAR